MCAADKVWITQLTLIHKNIRSVRNSQVQVIGQSDVKHIMPSPIKTIKLVLKASTDIITNIPAHPIGLAEILAIMSVSNFKIAVILYNFHSAVKFDVSNSCTTTPHSNKR